jgi:hypothetical protein
MIAQSQGTKPAGNPAQSFTGLMRIARVRIGCPDNFAK